MASSEDPTRVLPTVPAPPGAPPAGGGLTPHEPLPGGPGGPIDPPLPPTGGPGGGGGWDEGPGDPERERNTLLVFIAGLLVLIALLLAFFLLQGDDDGRITQTTPAAVESTPAATPTPAASPDDSASDDGAGAGEETPDTESGDTGSGSDGSTGGAAIGGDDTTDDTDAPADGGPLLTAGSVTKLKVKQGETVSFRVLSDTDEEVHVHGYDQKVDVRAGDEKTITLTADLTGIFEIELEGSATQIGELTVEP